MVTLEGLETFLAKVKNRSKFQKEKKNIKIARNEEMLNRDNVVRRF